MNKNIWNQLKNLTCEKIISALERDGWERDITKGVAQVYINNSNGRRIVIHYHPKKTYKPKLLKNLLNDIGWSGEDLKRLKLIK